MGWYLHNFLIDPQRSRGLRVAAPWCVEHVTLRSNTMKTCLKPSYDWICRFSFGSIAPFALRRLLPAKNRGAILCNHIEPSQHEHSYYNGLLPRGYDYGCGRGSYGEAMRRWDMSAVGIDGDARIVRSYYQMKAYSGI